MCRKASSSLRSGAGLLSRRIDSDDVRWNITSDESVYVASILNEFGKLFVINGLEKVDLDAFEGKSPGAFHSSL